MRTASWHPSLPFSYTIQTALGFRSDCRIEINATVDGFSVHCEFTIMSVLSSDNSDSQEKTGRE
jgi:hypothetical protein